MTELPETTMFVDHLLAAKNLMPVIVCGMPRSGTRMVADLLNRYSDVAIQQEMHTRTLQSFLEFTEQVSDNFKFYSERKNKPELGSWWANSQSPLAHAFFVLANKKGSVGGKKDLRFHGIKAPGYERYYLSFERLFSTVPPFYVYCIRNPEQVWRSWKNMVFENRVNKFRTRYKRSLNAAIKIRDACPGRLCIFDLDAYIASEDKEAYFSRTVCLPMGLDAETPEIKSAESLPNRNSLASTG